MTASDNRYGYESQQGYTGRPGEMCGANIEWPKPVKAEERDPPPEPGFIPARDKDPHTMTAEEQRRYASARLLQQLDVMSSLTEHCERLAAIPKNDRLAAVAIAARAVNASAHAAKAIAEITEVEHRHRRIVEVVQASPPQIPHSNSTFDVSAKSSADEPVGKAAEPKQKAEPKDEALAAS